MRIAIGLGSSLGDRERQLRRAIGQLARTPGLELLRVSRGYRTPPLAGGSARGWFLNGVATFEASLSAQEVLRRCVDLEEGAGRRRASHWGDRTLDLDVLLAEGLIVDSDRLTLPHPAVAVRPFVLVPLLEVWPEARDPRSGRRYAELGRPVGPRPVPVGLLAPRPPLAYL